MDEAAAGLADDLRRSEAEHVAGGRIDEGGEPVGVDAVEAVGGGFEDQPDVGFRA